MIRQCCVCHSIITPAGAFPARKVHGGWVYFSGESWCLAVGEISHGYCHECRDAQMADIGRMRAERMEASTP